MLRDGINFWRETSEIVLVEGAGGLMSPMSDDDYNADLAAEFGYPLVVVAANELGTINATLQTLITASTYCDGLDVAGIVLNSPTQLDDDAEHRQQRGRAGAALRRRRCWPTSNTAADSIAKWIGAVHCLQRSETVAAGACST